MTTLVKLLVRTTWMKFATLVMFEDTDSNQYFGLYNYYGQWFLWNTFLFSIPGLYC